MRLYLSSFRMGRHPEALLSLLRRDGPALVVANGLDEEPAEIRAERVSEELQRLSDVGVSGEELDLRDYLGGADDLAERLATAELLWLRGGNVFLVRYLLARTEADRAIIELLDEDRLVLAGYSVAPAIAGPSLRGFEVADDEEAVRRLYSEEPCWAGLGILTDVVVPHCDSPDHPATAVLNRLADDLERSGQSVTRLRDGEALVLDGTSPAIR